MSYQLPSLNALRAFEACARHLSVSRAAQELHVTHGAISRQIRSLEEQLGQRLIEKDGRGIKLTDSGLQLKDSCSEAFSQLAQGCERIRQRQQERPFVLGCPGSLLARWFIPRLDQLQRDLPQLRLQLSASEANLDPRHADLNATLWFSQPPWPHDVDVYELAPERIGPVFSAQHPNAQRWCNSPTQVLLDEALLHTASRPQAWPQWASAHAIDPNALQMGPSFEHLYYLLEAAIAGLGVAIAPEAVVADDLASGRLLAPWGFVETGARLCLWVPKRQPDGRAQALADWLQQQWQPQGSS